MAAGVKRKLAADEPVPVAKKTAKTTPPKPAQPIRDITSGSTKTPEGEGQSMRAQLDCIAAALHRTEFERRVWTLLCQVPRGQVTTYGIMAKHLNSKPRAVGGALRRNPFAPEVPCHRVVATGGSLGGFKGKWPTDGEGTTLDEKRLLLKQEGVRIDQEGKKVLGTPFAAFV